MSKQVTPPPPGDKPTPSAPPPPPAWRHWLWPIAILIVLGLWLALPAVHTSSPVTLNYTQFLTDVSNHQVKSIDLAQSGQTSTGTLTNGKDFTTVIPAQAGVAADRSSGGARPGNRGSHRLFVRLGGPVLGDYPAAAAAVRLSVVPAFP